MLFSPLFPRLPAAVRPCLAALISLFLAGPGDLTATAQEIVYRPMVPMFAPAAGPSVANYTPSGNYAAVTAYSPPVIQPLPIAAVAMPVTTFMPVSPTVTTYSLPAATTVARPVTAYYAPTYAAAAPYSVNYAPSYAGGYATTAFYAPAAVPMAQAPVAVTSYYAPAAQVVAPMTVVPMAPTAVAVPLYRRGLFGGLRPVRYWPY
ncbi:MAG: hypothetical protein DWH79_09580 [Planctomycetota bacterium]|nr:MAG: hypothetical protein DWH79_09580 [Planctomycetota bacterium]